MTYIYRTVAKFIDIIILIFKESNKLRTMYGVVGQLLCTFFVLHILKYFTPSYEQYLLKDNLLGQWSIFAYCSFFILLIFLLSSFSLWLADYEDLIDRTGKSSVIFLTVFYANSVAIFLLEKFNFLGIYGFTFPGPFLILMSMVFLVVISINIARSHAA
jgi:hypothetical protein